MPLGRLLRRSLWERYPRDHWQSAQAFRRRQLVTATVVVVGAVWLGLSLRIEPGSTSFYYATLGLAGLWTVGGFASGPLHLGRIRVGQVHARPVLQPIALGLALAGLFIVGALAVREVALLESQVSAVLAFADQGASALIVLVTVLNGIAEELFFRGAAYAAVRRHQVAVTSFAYCLTTAGTGNLMLVFAALVLGVVVGLQRRASGGVLAPILTHITWSTTMLFALPPLF